MVDYSCEHKVTIVRRCLDCDEKYKFIPREFAEEMRLLRALAAEIQEAKDKIILPKPVLDLLKIKDLY